MTSSDVADPFRVIVRAEKVYGNQTIESSVEIDGKYLPVAGQYFEAQLTRWKQKEVVISIPVECDVGHGARLLKLRLESESTLDTHGKAAEKGGEDEAEENKDDNQIAVAVTEVSPRPVAELPRPEQGEPNEAWSTFDWWKVSEGQVGQLSAALLVFQVALLNDFAQEVADALNAYHLRCPPAVAALAAESGIELRQRELVSDPLDLPADALQKTLEAAANTSEAHHAWRLMAERALAGSTSVANLPKILVGAYRCMFKWPNTPNSIFGADFVTPGSRKLDPCGVGRCFLDFVHQCICLRPEQVKDFAQEISSRVQQCPSSEHVWAREILTECAHALFIKSWIAAGDKDCDQLVQIYRIHIRNQEFVRPKIDPNIFAVASLEMQRKWLDLGSDSYNDVKDHAHLVHEKARLSLFKAVSQWTPKDVEFLASVPFHDPKA
mmetsp:Transcript_68237/g.142613  ORF Transcript_68237/g.142613 Transcript_68237/m.142613 type:complete len:438 (+) Transcript_68237:106-1419(+)|eukprot:CAMPEP_0206435498 /NCGR_PEP_ID=MMETSP0324_2-20121206/9902_1 /ASSEMBLY_ACC=CAM_ASM_000836 /TAXON_ID=2866 /ORGANISM="Crypthecodinium cohnii, Strain Seligo" /LENGTH=437 /DNA_ID=CAMNT_0053902441 /DNA_START=29 /DNA_END=1342 /DNA_ORIENTATION=+